ncbi:MAG: serine protease, partial [Bacteroidetes bacterium HGW-Bacteroidetes-22]
MTRIFFVSFFLLLSTLNLHAEEGMWIPLLLEQKNQTDMQTMGLKLTAADIYSVNQSSLKDAIVLFGGGCTGEVVSDQGLILTNHHCGFGQIQARSTIEHDYLTDGFWAMNQSEELPNPGLTVSFLVSMSDVTSEVLQGVTPQMSMNERYKKIRSNTSVIKRKATEGNHYEAQIRPFYYGNEYYLMIYEIFTDIRLVGAPPSNIGKFGGDTDNWIWPRHTGDFSIFRIYAGTDNKPAPYSKDNIPFKPRRHLSISLKGIQPGDFTFVYGFPGRTEEYLPAQGVDLAVNIVNPIRIALREIRLGIINSYSEKNDTIRLRYAAKHAGIANGWKKWIGESRGIKRIKGVEIKKEFETRFANWTGVDEV